MPHPGPNLVPMLRPNHRPGRPASIAVAAALVVALLAGCGGDDSGATPDSTVSQPGGSAGGQSAAQGFDADRAFADVETQVALGPRPAGSKASAELAELLAQQIKRAGVGEVTIQRPDANVVGTIPGEEPGFIVVGAHHDTKDIDGFVGANDGASGVAVVLELARSLPKPLPGPSLAIALFDAEEARGSRPFAVDGTRGSRQYVAYARDGRQRTPPLEEIRAMVLFDLVGDCDLQIPREAKSSAPLYGLFAAAGSGSAPTPFGGEVGPIGDDHVPFLQEGIEAVDLIDFTFGPGGTPGAFWHTTEDTLDKVCPESLAAVGEAALVAIPQIR